MSHGSLHGTLHAADADQALSVVDGIAARLYEQFEESPNVAAVSNWIAEQFQLLEEMIHDLMWFRFTRVAQGEVLDAKLANWERVRSGLSDDQVRALLQVLHPALLQHKTADTVINVAAAILTGSGASWSYADDFPAGFILTIADIDSGTAIDLNPLIRLAKAEGVRMRTFVNPVSAAAFQYDTGLGYDQGVYAFSL
ncbi:MAG: hypothetical protein GY926_19365 [bacterium]|nr:hypothetical protein [bacterium]